MLDTGLPLNPFSRVWLETVEILRADPVLARVVRTWIIPQGDPPPTEGNLARPLVRLEPGVGPLEWESEASHSGYLIINVRTQVHSYHATDRLEMWGALMNAFYPMDDRNRQLQIQQRLRDAGARATGLYEFNLPASDPDPQGVKEGGQSCDGQMRILVDWAFNP